MRLYIFTIGDLKPTTMKIKMFKEQKCPFKSFVKDTGSHWLLKRRLPTYPTLSFYGSVDDFKGLLINLSVIFFWISC